MIIEIFNESGVNLPDLLEDFRRILISIASSENTEYNFVEIVFVDEDGIVEVNKEHLGRDYVTDIISFHYQENNEGVEGTLFCCAERIQEQAKEFDVQFEIELKRIFIHGCLHLMGYNDQTPDDKQLMTSKENLYLSNL